MEYYHISWKMVYCSSYLCIDINVYTSLYVYYIYLYILYTAGESKLTLQVLMNLTSKFLNLRKRSAKYHYVFFGNCGFRKKYKSLVAILSVPKCPWKPLKWSFISVDVEGCSCVIMQNNCTFLQSSPPLYLF